MRIRPFNALLMCTVAAVALTVLSCKKHTPADNAVVPPTSEQQVMPASLEGVPGASDTSAVVEFEHAVTLVRQFKLKEAEDSLNRLVETHKGSEKYARAAELVSLLLLEHKSLNKEGLSVDAINASLRRLENNIAVDFNDNDYRAIAEVRDKLMEMAKTKKEEINDLQNLAPLLAAANKAFNDGKYEEEYGYLKQAAEYNDGLMDRAAQCRFYVEGVKKLDSKDWAGAKDLFSRVSATDRHYSLAQNGLRKADSMRDEIIDAQKRAELINGFRNALSVAWRAVDWQKLSSLMDSVPGGLDKILDAHVTLTKILLNDNRAYIDAPDELASIRQLQVMKTRVDEASLKDKTDYINLMKWVDGERTKLVSSLRSKLAQKVSEAENTLSKYKANPVTSAEIDEWPSGLDPSTVEQRATVLRDACGQLRDAKDICVIAGISDENVMSKYEQTTLDARELCQRMFKKAYVVLQNDGKQAGWVCQVYRICALLPDFDGPFNPNEVRIQLKRVCK